MHSWFASIASIVSSPSHVPLILLHLTKNSRYAFEFLPSYQSRLTSLLRTIRCKFSHFVLERSKFLTMQFSPQFQVDFKYKFRNCQKYQPRYEPMSNNYSNFWSYFGKNSTFTFLLASSSILASPFLWSPTTYLASAMSTRVVILASSSFWRSFSSAPSADSFSLDLWILVLDVRKSKRKL